MRGRAGEERLRELLRDAAVPAPEGAESRGLELALSAYEQRRPARRTPLPRLALALAIAALLAALLLSPAGAAVRDWVGDVFDGGVPDAERGLSEIPGGGRLLVQSAAGPWVVQADGSRRLLGNYDTATWSPHGLYVAAASGRTLSAVEPGGTPHWSLPAPGRVLDPRWSPSGFQIAYRAGRQLRVVAGDGEEDRLLDRRVAAAPPAWSPQGLALLAYLGTDGALRLVNTDSSATVGAAKALPDPIGLEWAPSGDSLLEVGRRSLRLRPVGLEKTLSRLRIGPARRLTLPPGATVRAAAFAPGGGEIAVLLRRGGNGGVEARSEVLAIDPRGGSSRRLFAVTGELSELAFSPDGGRLLLAWPRADQWLFLSAHGRGQLRAVGEVAAGFAPGAHLSAGFPAIAGWCCRAP